MNRTTRSAMNEELVTFKLTRSIHPQRLGCLR